VYNIDNFYNDYFFLLVVLPIDCQEASSSESSISSDTPTTTMYRYSARAAALEGSQKGVGAITHVERQSVVEIEEMERLRDSISACPSWRWGGVTWRQRCRACSWGCE